MRISIGIFASWFILGSLQMVSAEQLVTVVHDADGGIQSKIYFESDSNLIGETNDEGVLWTEKACKRGLDVIAKPESALYKTGKKLCNSSDQIIVNVEWKPIYVNLIRNREIFIARKDFGAAALVSNEISARSTEIAIKQQEGVLAIEYLGKLLGLPESESAVSVDPIQGREVATPAMVEAVKQFQQQSGIPITGAVDYQTLSKAAGREIGSVMFAVVR